MRLRWTSRWRRVFVFLAVGFSLSSCDTQDIGQGYELKFAERGKTWIVGPDSSIADGDLVLGVWSDDEVVVYQVYGDDPATCDYRMIRKQDGARNAISAAQAAEIVTTRSAELRTSSSSSCPLGSRRR